MTYTSIKKISYISSILFHLIIFILFLTINFSLESPKDSTVELSFGTFNKTGSAGAIGSEIDKIEEISKDEVKDVSVEKNIEVKDVNLPKAKNPENKQLLKPTKEKEEKIAAEKNDKKQKMESKVSSTGKGNKAIGSGSFGYDIDWGGRGQRKIYSYKLPEYPEGVQKEIDIRLRFSILPDGTVGNIFPLIKADTRLENAAINSLRQWRFEALAPNQKQVEQVAVIVFPYRLK